jgi:hypothetical protein
MVTTINRFLPETNETKAPQNQGYFLPIKRESCRQLGNLQLALEDAQRRECTDPRGISSEQRNCQSYSDRARATMNLSMRESHISEEERSECVQRDQDIFIEIGVIQRRSRECISAFRVIPSMYVSI